MFKQLALLSKKFNLTRQFSTLANPTVIEPKFWTGKNAIDSSKFVIDCSQYQNKEFSQFKDELQQKMDDTFEKVGLIILKNTGLTELSEMHKWVMLQLREQMDYKGGANDRNVIEKNVYDVGAPMKSWLHHHHEMAYITKSTTKLGFCCKKGCGPKGSTYLSDNIGVTDELMKTELGQKLKEKGICYHRRLTDREYYRTNNKAESDVYNHWQQSFMTEEPDVAVQRAGERGLRTEWWENRKLNTKFYVSAFEYCPFTKKNLIFSSIADDHMWFDDWKGVQEVPIEERPLKLTFGDDTEMTWEEKKQFVDVYDKHGIQCAWEVGDIAIICNYRFAHGRPGIHLEEGEQRELGVILGRQFDRQGDLVGKW